MEETKQLINHKQLESKHENIETLTLEEINFITEILFHEFDKTPVFEIYVTNSIYINKGPDQSPIWPDVLHLSDDIYSSIIVSVLNYLVFWDTVDHFHDMPLYEDFDILKLTNIDDLLDFIGENLPSYTELGDKIECNKDYDHESAINIVFKQWNRFKEHRDYIWALWPSS